MSKKYQWIKTENVQEEMSVKLQRYEGIDFVMEILVGKIGKVVQVGNIIWVKVGDVQCKWPKDALLTKEACNERRKK